MLGKILKREDRSGGAENAARLLTLELSEITEISDGLYRKLEEKMSALRLLHERADEKIMLLERLIARAESMDPSAEQAARRRRREIASLAGRGLKVDEIAGIVDMPVGEVELVLSMSK